MAPRNFRARFEESDFDDAGDAHFGHSADGSNLPPVEFKVEEIADNATPEEMIHAAMEERVVDTALDADTSFGAVVIPSEKTLYGYKYALSSSGHTIRFSHTSYPLFDGDVTRAAGADAGGNPVHPAFSPRFEAYSDYAPLRRNLAILRNYLMAAYPPARGKANQAALAAMAEKLGLALKGQSKKLTLIGRIMEMIRQLMKAPFKADANRFLELANTPDRGIAFMYDYLLRAQGGPDPKGALPGSQAPKDWKLLPLEETPFSGENMARYSDAARMGVIASAMELVTRNLNSVDDMTPQDKEISVEHARDILKNLRIILTGAQEEKQYDEMDTRCREAQSMLNSALCFQGALAGLAKSDPDLLNDPLILEASKAITKIGSRVKQEEQVMRKQEHRAETTTSPQQPQQSRTRTRPDKQKSSESIQKLVFKFDEGINRAGEIRRTQQARLRQRSSLQQAMGQQAGLQKTLSDGMSTMSNPKIHQVSVSDPNFIETVKKLNEEKTVEPQKNLPGGQSLGGK